MDNILTLCGQLCNVNCYTYLLEDPSKGNVRGYKSLVTFLAWINLQPIFHCDTKTLALGPCVGRNPQCESFALGITTCLDLKTLKFALPPMPNLEFAF